MKIIQDLKSIPITDCLKIFMLQVNLVLKSFTTETDYLNTTSTGSFIKAGIDFNMYDNWLDMNNMIYFGFRFVQVLLNIK